MRLLPLLAATLPACNGDDPSQQSPPQTNEILSASCTPTDNPLRFTCEAELDTAEATTWTFLDGPATARTLTAEPSTTPSVSLWGVRSEATLTATVTTDSGVEKTFSLTTGALPVEVAALTTDLFGAPVSLKHFAAQYRCGPAYGLAVFRTDGEIVWYEPLPAIPQPGVGPTVGIVGFDWSRDNQIVAVLDGDRVLRFDPMGVRQFDVSGFERPLHHDVAIHGDRTVALAAYAENDLVLDGLYILDAQGETAGTFSLGDAIDVQGPGIDGPFWDFLWPDATDWSHSNGVTPDGPQHVLLSSRWQDAILRIDVDPTSPTFGDIDWTLVGTSDSQLTSDYTWTDGGGFTGQHHPQRRPGGGISVFDNGPDGANSRALLLDLDETNQTVSEAASWDMGLHCPVMGGVYELDSGSVLATCSSAGGVGEFVPGQTVAAYRVILGCNGIPMADINRARPISLD